MNTDNKESYYKKNRKACLKYQKEYGEQRRDKLRKYSRDYYFKNRMKNITDKKELYELEMKKVKCEYKSVQKKLDNLAKKEQVLKKRQMKDEIKIIVNFD
jgi:hypothetical protein